MGKAKFEQQYTIKVQNVRLQEESLAKQRIEREMALAWEIQRRLLPEKAPDLQNTDLLGGTIPSRTVSGDYFDFIPLDDVSCAFDTWSLFRITSELA